MTINRVISLLNKSKDGYISADKKKTCEFITKNKSKFIELGYNVKLDYFTTSYSSSTMHIFLGYTITKIKGD